MNLLRKNLTYLIAKRQLNPTQLSRETGVPQPTIKRILDGTSEDPRTSTLAPLADYFGCTVSFLRTGDIENHDAHADAVVNAIDGEESGARDFSTETQEVDVTEQPIRLRRIRRPPTPAEQAFADALPSDLTRNVGYGARLAGNLYLFSYCSNKLVAQICPLVIRESGNTRIVSTSAPSRHLWRLSAFRLATLEALPDRQYVLFLPLAYEGKEKGALPVEVISKLTWEGSLHGINVIWTDASAAAGYVAAVEQGTVKPLLETTFDED